VQSPNQEENCRHSKGQPTLILAIVHAGRSRIARFGRRNSFETDPGETDYTQQLQIGGRHDHQHVDAICLAPIDKTSMVSVVERAAKQKHSGDHLDSGIDTENFVSQVATDNYLAGKWQPRHRQILMAKAKWLSSR